MKMIQPLASRSRLRNTKPGFQAGRRLRASGDAGCFGPAGSIGCVAIARFPGAGASQYRLVTWVDLQVSSRLQGLARMLIGPGRFPRPGRPESPGIPRCTRLRVRWGRVQRFSLSCQRGVVLSAGEPWSAGRVMVFQHPSASVGFQEGIQVRMPAYQVQWHQSSPKNLVLPQGRSIRASPAGNAAPGLPRQPGLQAFRPMAESST